MEHIELKNKSILITGAAGFIGSNLVMKLIKTGEPMKLVGLDNMNDYYDVSLKEYRLSEIEKLAAENEQVEWWFIKGDLADKALIDSAFEDYRFDIVVNLAAQAGVRYSIENPDAYINSNLIGFYNILEACRHSYHNGAKGVEHLVYASSSSVYGGNKKVPFSTDDKVDNPVSLYAATKKEQRAFGAFLLKALQYPLNRASLLYGLRPRRPPRYGVLRLYKQAVKGRDDKNIQFRQLQARFHLCR